jgi:hypothetical protein
MCIKIYDLATCATDLIVSNHFFIKLDNHKKKHKRNKVQINFFSQKQKKCQNIVNVFCKRTNNNYEFKI